MSKYVDIDEHFKIARELEKHHAIFERVWSMGRIRYSTKVPTAAVLFNKKGECVDFIVNRDFWEEQSFIQKCFIISHECLHIALNHGRRVENLYGDRSKIMISNFAQDLVINHALINRYGFDQDEIDPKNNEDPFTGQMLRKYCWIEKFFPEENVADDENFEYYYNKIYKEYEKANEQFKKMMENSETVDEHSFGEGGTKPNEEQSGNSEGNSDDPDNFDFVDPEQYSDDFSDVIKKLNNELNNEDKDTLKNFIEENEEKNPTYGPTGESAGCKNGKGGTQAGTTAGTAWTFAGKTEPKKRKWESIVTDWAKKKLVEKEKTIDQWTHKNRRFSMMNNTGLFLPMEYDILEKFREGDLIETWFFQDTSGSCSGYTDRFFAVAESMPLDRFKMRLFCFDTKVYETSLESRKLYGFGGTYFHILENYIQEAMEKDSTLKYPDAVFVITDGYGSNIVPKMPERWHWILTPQHSRENIPKTCNFYNLASYE